MTFQLGKDRGFHELKSVGLAIKEIEPSQRHIGILFRLGDEEPQFCHLAFHHDLRCHRPPDDYHWDQCHFLQDDPGALALAIKIQLVANETSIPYGLDYSGNPFSSSGEYVEMPLGKGLTCATFVTAVFHSFGYPILQLETWEARGDDEDWQNKILDLLRKYNASEDRIEATRNDVGAPRIRPEEVAAGGTNLRPPLTFQEAKSEASNILAAIKSSP